MNMHKRLRLTPLDRQEIWRLHQGVNWTIQVWQNPLERRKRKAGRSLIPDRTDITERPAIVEQCARLGDWEGDTVYGQDAHLVTLVDRKSRLTMIGKVAIKNAETVASKMIEMLQRAPGAKTITLDNGGEFAMHAKVSKAVNVDVYFAKPYASYQRRTNENTNGIIRRQ